VNVNLTSGSVRTEHQHQQKDWQKVFHVCSLSLQINRGFTTDLYTNMYIAEN